MNWLYETILGIFYKMDEREPRKPYDPMMFWDNSGKRIDKALANPNFCEENWRNEIKICGVAPSLATFEKIAEFVHTCGKVRWIKPIEGTEEVPIKYFVPFEGIMTCNSKEGMEKILQSLWLSDLWVDEGLRAYLCM